ncbi:2-methylisoborneol synthase [Amycolatopsis xylanica]|uniref:2-methylisoborneol synthase n=1 Tax=Amycolatopsis xylanica TaxID=589385 RepID=A0A1H2S827_9PSEU|nr:family 2 encapsulin nanocompartment cargo protein terpene cyclase [Amycolatopsis xylanica]SDW27690.1 2-methylisoborneol synthase [Amycolatopsis xylanica]
MTETVTATEELAPAVSPQVRGCPLRTVPAVTASALAGPSGLGTSAARLTTQFGPDPAYAEVAWGDGKASPLYVPVLERTNDALGAEVDRRLVEWAGDCGFSEEEQEKLLKAGFGRLVMLAHADCDDPDRLLISAQLNAAWWAADDYYADDSEMGAVPTRLPPRLALVMAAMDPVAPAGEFTEELDKALRGDPILIALNSGVEHLTKHGTPSQVQRICYATFAMFVTWNAYAAWRYTGEYPPAWEYLAARQHDSFYTSMTLVDAVGGYELPANLYYDPRVRLALTQAGTASVMVNDLFSVAKDAADENPVCNMVLQIAADKDISIEDATEITVDLHNQLVRDFEAGHRALLAVPSPELHRFLRGVRAWMGGGFEWHNTNPRYRT